MQKVQLPNIDKYYITKIEKTSGVFQRENGDEIPFDSYNVYFKREGYELEFKAKLDKVFKDYIEEN